MFRARVCPFTESNTWSVPETQGAVPQGGYGHTSTYDASSGSLYVHGGFKSLPANKYGLVDDLYRYDVNSRTWLVITHTHTHTHIRRHSTVFFAAVLDMVWTLCALCTTCSLVVLACVSGVF